MAAPKSSSRPRDRPTRASRTTGAAASRATGAVAEGLTGLASQLVNRVIRPLGLVLLTRERIQETLDDAAERGRLTRSDANELVAELVSRGRQQTEDLLSDLERLLSRGRRSAETQPSLPIPGYDDLTARQIQERLGSLTPPQLRALRGYERSHANRKSVLGPIDKSLS
jgi:polyhydroxyalkanoate synthesis regulator phasin